MKKGLAITAVIYAALYFGYRFLLMPRFSPPGDLYGALIAAFFTTMAIGVLRNARLAFADFMRLNRPVNALMFKSSKEIGVSGGIFSSAQPLKSPFQKIDSVFYSYEIYTERSNNDDAGTTKSLAYSGMSMIPGEIRSQSATIAVLSFPLLEGFPEQLCAGSDVLANANEFVAKTTFDDMTGFKVVGKMYTQIKDIFKASDGYLEKNWRMKSGVDLSEETLMEQVVRVGDEVCAFGRYSPEKRGMTGGEGSVVRLYRGSKEQVSKSLMRTARARLIGGIVFLGIINGALFGSMTLREKSADVKKDNVETIAKALETDNLSKVSEILQRNFDPNSTDGNERTALMFAKSPQAVHTIVSAGADVNWKASDGQTALMVAAHEGRNEVVKALIDEKADVNAVNSKWRSTAISQAEDAGHEDTADLLLKAGAKDERVTAANGKPLPADGGEPFATCVRYIAAIHARDIPTLKSLYLGLDPDFFDTVDYQVWHDTRPVKPLFIQGFSNDTRATLKVHGTTGSGYDEPWTYYLARQGKDWKIIRERD